MKMNVKGKWISLKIKQITFCKLNENFFSVRRNERGNPVRCFVNQITQACSFCEFEVNCRHVKAVTIGNAIYPTCHKTITSYMNEDDKTWVEERDNKIMVIKDETIKDETVLIVKDDSAKFGYVHCSFKKCYTCNITNSLNSGPLKQGPNCEHKLALMATFGKSTSNEPNPKEPEVEAINNDEDVQLNPANKKVDHELSSKILFNNILSNFPSHMDMDSIISCQRTGTPADIDIYLQYKYDLIVKCENCESNKISAYKYNKNTKSCNFVTF